ncbi:MAG: hypothetical protein H7330_07005 [Hymenobacteraceae bacterium]|nr:hypothetical protein [Hymenobacteraceae bacterium]
MRYCHRLLLWLLLLIPGGALPGLAQQHLSLWDTTRDNRHRFDIHVACRPETPPSDKAIRGLSVNPTMIYNHLLTAVAPADSVRDVIVAQLAVSTDPHDLLSRTAPAHRYESLLRAGLANPAFSLIGAHYLDHALTIRVWVNGTIGGKLLSYAPSSADSVSRRLFYQRYASLGGGFGYGPYLAFNVQWGRATHDLTTTTRTFFREQFGPELRARYVEASLRVRISPWPSEWPTGKKKPIGGVYATASFRRFYQDYGQPELVLLGVSVVPSW